MTGNNTQYRVTVATWSLSGFTQPLSQHRRLREQSPCGTFN